MLEYQRVLNSHKKADDPWKELANAIVEMTADDYRKNMTRLLGRGLSMSDFELATVQSHITECRIFFESDWGYLLSHGLANVIWEKLQAEFAADLARFEARLPYMQKHRAKLKRRHKKAEERWRKNKLRHNRQKQNRKAKREDKTNAEEY